MTAFQTSALIVLSAALIISAIIFLGPGIEAMYFWMCAKRDELANRALIAKRERR